MIYPDNSRYKKVPTRIWRRADGAQIAYSAVLRRSQLTDIASETRISEGDRLDLIAWRILGDPTQFWRVADINITFDPFELTDTPGGAIGLPERP